jgi:hypothetical protein
LTEIVITAHTARPQSMCVNAFGLGALNVYWIVVGLLISLLNVLPFSTDCTQAMPSWLGVAHECNSLEAFLNLVWCFSVVGWGVTVAAVGALPKMVTVPAQVNKTAMLAVSAASLIMIVAYLVIAFTVTVEAEGATANLKGTIGSFQGLTLGFLLVAILVHREPTTGEKAMF